MNETRHVRARAVVAALVAVAFVGLAAAAGTYELELWGGKTVPSVRGIAETRAVQEVQAKGLRVEIEERPSDSGIGYVLATEPDAGSRVEEGGTVKLVVSANRTVPALVGLTIDEARKALDDMGAQNVRVTYDSSRDEAEGTVLSVDPAEGTVITSSDEVRLVVAQAPVVPDVVGKSESDATETLDAAGLTAQVSYVRQGSGERGTVLSTSPEAGQVAGDDGIVTLTVVNPYPTDFRHLLEYFSSEAGELPQWLVKRCGFDLKVGYKSSDNHAVEQLADSSGNVVTFTAQPWTATVTQPEGTEARDVITSGAFYDGIRLQIPEAQSPDAGATQVSAQEVIEECGFGSATDSCTQADITKPGITSPSANFYCASGEAGSYAWAVLVESTSDTRTRAVCVAAPKELFEEQDLSQCGGSVCDFVAYHEMYGKRS